MGSSGLSRMIAVDSFHESIGRPATETMRSPGSMPAAAPGRRRVAGLAGLALARRGEGARRDRADGRRGLCHAESHQEHPEEHDGQHEVHERAAEHDDDALPHGQSIERAVLVAGRDRVHAGVTGVLHETAEEPRRVLVDPLALGRREHADHRDVAAERDRLHAVLGLAAAPRPDGRPEADHVLGHLDAEQLGGHEVPDLVQADRQGEADHDDDDADDEGEHGIHPMSVLPTPWGPLSFGCENGCRDPLGRRGLRSARDAADALVRRAPCDALRLRRARRP